ncbi:MAG: M17 family peptidase N-terminal domain-containing protein, partial [Asticcacaulis sp.]
MRIELSSVIPAEAALAVIVGDTLSLSTGAGTLEAATGGYLTAALKKAGFTGARGKVQVVSALPDQTYAALVAVGAGALDEL